MLPWHDHRQTRCTWSQPQEEIITSPKQYLNPGALLTAALTLFMPVPSTAAPNSLPKNRLALSQAPLPSSCSGGLQKLVAATPGKGRKKHLLVANVTSTTVPTNAPNQMILSLIVNSDWMQPFGDDSTLPATPRYGKANRPVRPLTT